MAGESGGKDELWWQRRWWIPGIVLVLLVIVDLVAAFRFASDRDLRGTILGLLTPVVALLAGGAALLNFQETRRQNDRTFRTTQEQLRLAHDQFAESQARNREQVELQRRGQVTERFGKAIEQLGQRGENESEKLDVRLGGVYALEQIARDSPELHIVHSNGRSGHRLTGGGRTHQTVTAIDRQPRRWLTLASTD